MYIFLQKIINHQKLIVACFYSKLYDKKWASYLKKVSGGYFFEKKNIEKKGLFFRNVKNRTFFDDFVWKLVVIDENGAF